MNASKANEIAVKASKISKQTLKEIEVAAASGLLRTWVMSGCPSEIAALKKAGYHAYMSFNGLEIDWG